MTPTYIRLPTSTPIFPLAVSAVQLGSHDWPIGNPWHSAARFHSWTGTTTASQSEQWRPPFLNNVSLLTQTVLFGNNTLLVYSAAGVSLGQHLAS